MPRVKLIFNNNILGDTPLDISWSFQGGPLSTHLGLKTTLIGARLSMLLVEPVIPGNQGTYVCTARNAAGVANSSAVLEVFGEFAIQICSGES